MTKPQVGLGEIKAFIGSFTVPTDHSDFHSQKARGLYRRFHALLLWEIPLDSDRQAPAVRLYLRESLSDTASAYMLNFMGGYKAARLCLRGAIENSIRAITAAAGVDILTITSVYALVDHCRRDWATTPKRLETLNNLYGIYTELCNTVHSTSVGYMALRVPFEKIFEYEEAIERSNASVMNNTMKLIGDAFYLTFHASLEGLDYRNADYIRDTVEAVVKREATGLQ